MSIGPAYILTLDIGTSSLKAILYNESGTAHPTAWVQIPYEMTLTPDGGQETDPEEMVNRACRAIDQVLAAARQANIEQRIGGVACSTFWHNVLGVGKKGRSVTPCYIWADTRSEQEVPRLRQLLNEEAVHARTGCVFHSSYLPAKLLWLARTQPAQFKEAQRWMSLGEYLYLRLLGKPLCSISMASGTGILNQHTCTWDEEVLSVLPVKAEQFSPLGDYNIPLRGLQNEYARRWPALREIPWFPAAGDGACSNIGCGAVTADRAALMIGTSGALRMLWPAKDVLIPKGLWCYRPDGKRFVMGGALSGGGNVYAWMQETINLPAHENSEARLLDRAPDGHGLTVLPFLAGERSPGWAPNARGAVLGLTLKTTSLDILQAALEGIAYRFGAIYALLQKQLPPVKQIIASGGALLRSPQWVQIVCNVLGQPLTISQEPQASNRGAALLALEALGILSNLEEAPLNLGLVYQPNPEYYPIYQAALVRQQHYYDLLIKP